MADIASDGRARRIPWRFIGWGGAVALLAVPFVAMQFTREMNWGAGDFIFVGVLIGTVGLLLELAVRVSSNWSYRVAFGLALLGTVLVIWANLAVGTVGSEGNPANLLFFAALLVGMVGAAFSRLRPRGMAVATFATAVALLVALAVAQGGPTDEPWVPAVREIIGTSVFALLFAASAGLFRRAAKASR